MSNRVVILIDGAFFSIKFHVINKRHPKKEDVGRFVADILLKIQTLNSSKVEDVLIRTYYYDCPPFKGIIKKKDGIGDIDMEKSVHYEHRKNYIDSLRTMPQMALRLGEMSFNGWKIDQFSKNTKYKPEFRQKGVDMKIGLDVAWIASKKTADKIVLVTGDSDFISPMKLARREGILVYLAPIAMPVVESKK